MSKPPKDTLRPINPDNAWDLRITAAAGYGFKTMDYITAPFGVAIWRIWRFIYLLKRYISALSLSL